MNESWVADNIESVYVAWNRFLSAMGPVDQANALISVNDSLNDLFTHHPRYSYSHREIDGVYEELL